MNIADVKQSVQKAIDYVATLYEGEDIRNLGLEEVEYKEEQGVWSITVGFSRPWQEKGALAMLSSQGSAPPRTYKVITIRNDGDVISVKSRES